jgi:sugar-specific transcriptional regulator TrmB
MSFTDEALQSLHTLGLTLLESKSYLVLLKSGRSKIEQIAATAKLHRSSIYQAMKQLQKMGLVSKILGRPNLYEAISLKEASKILIKLKEDKFNEAKREANELSNLGVNADALQGPPNSEFNIIKRPKELFLSDIILACKSIDVSFDLMINAKYFIDGMINLSKHQIKCIMRGVNYRVITEKIPTKEEQKLLGNFLEYQNFKLKFFPEPLSTEYGISDKKFATLILTPNITMGESLLLNTNHKGFVKILQNHFDKSWNEAEEYKL